MKIVIQCAKQKNPAGYWRAENDKPVMFVARPQGGLSAFNGVYVTPDDLSDHDETWRTQLLKYNPKSLIHTKRLLIAHHRLLIIRWRRLRAPA
jgi:hypothetical protein